MLSGENFMIPPAPRLFFGRGTSLQISEHLQGLGLGSAFIVTDKNLNASGVIAPVIDALKTAGIQVDVFDGVAPNPTNENVEDGAAQLGRLGEACLVAIGGGSSIDCAKAIALLAANGGTVEEMQMLVPPAPANLPIIAIPTTAGTGSETNGASVITISTLGRKVYVGHPSVIPAIAVLDPDLTMGLPVYPTATCGFDVLTHATEAFVSVAANSWSDKIALDAIGKVAGHLRRVVTDGSDVEARAQMLLGSNLAATAFNSAFLGAVHGTGHALSARLNAAHGQTLATMMPHVMEYNMSERAEKYAEVARLLDPSSATTPGGAIDTVLKLRSDIGIEKSIRDLGGGEDMIPTLVEDAQADPINAFNPRPVDAAGLESLFRAAL